MSDKSIKVSESASRKAMELAERYGISQKRVLELAIDDFFQSANPDQITIPAVKEQSGKYEVRTNKPKKGDHHGE